MTTIYALVDPRTDVVRYVGRTGDVRERYQAHLSCNPGAAYYPAAKAKSAWVLELREVGLRPTLRILEECEEDVSLDREGYWIVLYQGPMLFNRKVRQPGRKRGPAGSRRNHAINISLTVPEAKRLERLAMDDGHSMSSWARRAILRHLSAVRESQEATS